jgi:hypothetical protein
MDNFDNLTPSQPGSDDLQQEFDALRSLVLAVLVLVLVISGTLNIFLWRQVRWAGGDLDQTNKQAAQVHSQVQTEYNRLNGPSFQDFLRKLSDYGRTHPDFAQIATKFQLNEVPAASASNTSTKVTPAPAKAPSTPAKAPSSSAPATKK